MARTIYGIGETVYDIIFKNTQPVAAKAGGSVLNSIISMGRLKLPVHFISEYADDMIGDTIDAFLKTNGVQTDCIYRHADGKTTIAMAFLNERNDASYTFYKEPPKERLRNSFPSLKTNDLVLFGSFFSISKDLRPRVKEFLEAARSAGAFLYYDPNFRKGHLHELETIRPFLLENMSMATVVRGSNEDFEHIFGAKNADEAYEQVKKYCPYLIYTASVEGVYLRTPNLSIKVEVKKITPVSTIGAGDNFNAGFLSALYLLQTQKEQLADLTAEQWAKHLQSGIDFASDVCMSYDNYISEAFVASFRL